MTLEGAESYDRIWCSVDELGERYRLNHAIVV